MSKHDEARMEADLTIDTAEVAELAAAFFVDAIVTVPGDSLIATVGSARAKACEAAGQAKS